MKKFILFITLCFPLLLRGQDNYTLKFLPQLQQSQWFNASNQPDSKVIIGLPLISSFSFYVYNSGFTFHDVFKTVNDSTKSVNMGAIFNQLKPQNYVSFGAVVPILSVNIARNNFSGGISIADKVDFQFNYPSSMFNFLWYGNGHYLGKNVDVGNFGVNASWYREFAFHAAYKYKKWTFGMSPKILVGKTNINTTQSSLIVHTDSNNFYKLSATANMNIKMSGIADSNDDAKGGYFNNAEGIINYVFDVQNIGHAIDLGVRYEHSERLNFSAGINNLGYINWKGYIHNYVASNQTFTFDGLHLENFFQGDTTAVTSQTLKDSVKSLLKFNKNSNPYTTYLPYDFFVMANYELKHHWFGLEFTSRRFNGQFLYAGTACYQLKFGKHFTGAVTYTLKSYSAFNLGGGLIFQFLNMQYYFVTDNWLAAVRPLDSKNANLNVGMNLVFGNRIRKDQPITDDATETYKPMP